MKRAYIDRVLSPWHGLLIAFGLPGMAAEALGAPFEWCFLVGLFGVVSYLVWRLRKGANG